VRTSYEPPRPSLEQRRFEDNRPNLTGGNREWNRNYTAPAMQPPTQRSFTPEQPGREFGRQYDPRNFAPPQQQPQQRGFVTPQPRPDFSHQMQQNFTARPPMEQQNFRAPRQIEQRSSTPQPRNEGGSGRGGEGRGRGR